MKRLALALALIACATRAHAADDPEKIAHQVGEKFAKACDSGVVGAVLGLYQADARVVYPGAGQSATDKESLAKLVTDTCKPGAPKPELVGYRAVWVDKAHTVIAALGDWKLTAPGPDGKDVVTPIRATEVLVKTKGGWKYAVDHASIGVPPAP
jgi:ketosteroid isomerase-like protein